MPSNSNKQTPVLKETELRSSSRARVLSSKDDNGSVEAGEASFRVYYGATGAAVPFMWESQPGTPKHPIFDKSNDDIVPPLNPPPSYKSPSSTMKTMCRKSWSFSTLFSFSSSASASSRRRSTSHVTPSPSLSSSSSSYSGHIRSSSTSSSSSSAASLSSPHLSAGRKKQMYHKRSASSLCFSGHKSLLGDDDEGPGSRSPPASTMCFGFSKKQGCYSMEDVKNAILSS